MDADALISVWSGLVQQFSFLFTTPTAAVWRQIVLGWILHRGPATVTGMFRVLSGLAAMGGGEWAATGADGLADRHWTVYHKFFYRARWSLADLCAAVMSRVIREMVLASGKTDDTTKQPAVDLAIDDTTVARHGKRVAHAGWYKDASATGPACKGTVIHWGHNWLVGTFLVRLKDWPLMRWALPAVFAL